MTCPPGPAFGEYCGRAWVELIYPLTPCSPGTVLLPVQWLPAEQSKARDNNAVIAKK